MIISFPFEHAEVLTLAQLHCI